MAHDPLEPDNAELQQVEAPALPLGPIPVKVEGPVRVQTMPAKGEGAYRIVQVAGLVTSGASGSGAVRVLTADPRRQSAYVLAIDNDLYIGSEMGQANNAQVAMPWPAGTPMPVGHAGEVWASSQSSSGSVVAIIAEQWAD